jgi:hypothetical protein
VRENERGIANLRVNVRCVGTAIEHQVWWRYATFKSSWKWDAIIIYVCRDDANMVMDKMFLGDEPRPRTLRLVFGSSGPCVWELRPVFGVETWAEDPRRPW